MSSRKKNLELIDPKIHSEITERMREEMKEQGLTQQQLAEAIGMERSYLSKVLNGKALPSGYFLILIAQQGWDVGYILSGKGSKTDTVERLEKMEFLVENLFEQLKSK